MKKTLTKAMAMALAFILLFGSAATGVGGFAQVLDKISIRASAATVDDLTYLIENGEVMIKRCAEDADGELTIPSEIEGYPVTSIGASAFNHCIGLTSIIIPDCVTNIGSRAFGSCTELTSITIPESVTNIGSGAFGGCTELTSITIPESVTNIGSGAFSSCIGLTSITIPESVTSIGDSAFAYCFGLTEIKYNAKNVTSSSFVFPYLGTAEAGINVVIGDHVETIPDLLFASANIKSLIIGKNVTNIGNRAFDSCTGLTSMVIPESVTNIGNRAFYNCTGLESITIGSGVTSIGNGAFEYCTGLKDVYYNGTKKDRENKLSIENNNDYLLNATWHYAEIRLENTKINVKSDEVYKNSKVTVTATAENVPEGYYLAVYDSGNEPVAKGDNKAVNYEIPGKVASDKTLTVKVVDADNNTQKDGNGKDLTAEINIKVKTGFFDILIAFFKMIFGMNKVTIKP